MEHMDVPTALGARRYPTRADVVLDIVDELIPRNAGRWHLTGGPEGAGCVRTDAPADLRLDVRELGAAYLGSVSLTAQAAAGLVQVHDGAALLRAATAFGWPVAASCTWTF